MQIDGVHCGEDGLAFGGGGDEGEEARGVACGEDDEDYGGDAVDPSGFHFWVPFDRDGRRGFIRLIRI